MLILIGSGQEVEGGGIQIVKYDRGWLYNSHYGRIITTYFLLTWLFVVTFCDKIRGADWWECD